jgi:hypothetical protein
LLVSVKGTGFWDVCFQCGECSNYGLLGYAHRQVLLLERNMLPPPSGSTVKLKGACSSKTLIHIYKSPHHHLLVAHSLAFVLFIQDDQKVWWLQYRKVQVTFKVSPTSLQTFIDKPNCILEDHVRYSKVHILNVFCDGHLQIINFVLWLSGAQRLFDHLVEVIRVPTSATIKEFSCITAISWQVTNVHQITYLDRKNGNSSNERDVAIRMYAKLKPNEIPTARVNMNVFPTAGLNSPETIKSNYQSFITNWCTRELL